MSEMVSEAFAGLFAQYEEHLRSQRNGGGCDSYQARKLLRDLLKGKRRPSIPAYNSQAVSNSPLTQLFPGDTGVLFNAEKPITGSASIAFCITPLTEREVRGISVELIFPAAPGAFNYQIQSADTYDATGSAFFTGGTSTIVAGTVEPDGTTRARVELSPWIGKFVRLLVNQANANNVAVTANVTVH